MLRIFLLISCFVAGSVNAAGYSSNQMQIQEQVRETVQMSDRCLENIEYYNDKIAKYEYRIALTDYQRLKLDYYKQELRSWENYCYNGGLDPDFN
jgi:hypothetical protein